MVSGTSRHLRKPALTGASRPRPVARHPQGEGAAARRLLLSWACRLVSWRGGSDSPPVKRVNVAGWLFVVLVTLLVEAGVRAFDYETSIATPSSTLKALVDELWSGSLSGELGDTLSAYFQGLALAIVVGVGAGLLIGTSRTLLDATSVVIEFLRPIPGIALIPLAILSFGLGVPTVRFVVAYAAAWPILFNTLYGVRGVDRMLHDVARDLRRRSYGQALQSDAPGGAPEHRHGHPGQRRDRACSCA